LQISELNTWLRAARPQTLVAALIPVLVGACLAWKDDHFHTTASSIALLCAFLIQIGTNFANDYFDYVKGADNEERIGFVRATSAGLITPEKMFTATVITMSLAFIFGLYLVWLGGWVILILGVLSLIFGILDLKSNQFKFSRAGHNPVLYYKSSEDKLYEYQPKGIAVGMANDDVFRTHIAEETIHLEKDDIIILFTDGVVESISKTNKLYGDQRLQNLVKRNYLLSSTQLLKKLEDDLDKFGEKSSKHDDLTMIVIKKK